MSLKKKGDVSMEFTTAIIIIGLGITSGYCLAWLIDKLTEEKVRKDDV
jgi:hypothetical protein